MARRRKDADCPGCAGLFGPLGAGERIHRLCEWMTPTDWAALRPYLDGSLLGVWSSGT